MNEFFHLKKKLSFNNNNNNNNNNVRFNTIIPNGGVSNFCSNSL